MNMGYNPALSAGGTNRDLELTNSEGYNTAGPNTS